MTTSTSRAATPPSPAYSVAGTLNETRDSHHVGSQQKPDPERVRNLSRSFDIDMMPDNDNGTLPAAITNTDATCPDSDRSQDNGRCLDLASSSTSTSTPSSAPQMASTEESPVLSGRNCFVTIGSIASFLPLLEQVITGPFLTHLQVAGFKKLTVQCGPNLAWFETQLEALRSGELLADLQVECFSYAPVLKPYMLECRGEQGKSLAGCVIAHAGAGTILEVRRYGAPLIVVPNPTLMDNHQLELAVEVQRQGWAVHGKVDNLPHAIDKRSLSARNTCCNWSRLTRDRKPGRKLELGLAAQLLTPHGCNWTRNPTVMAAVTQCRKSKLDSVMLPLW
ncbi:N-acetylglucosaminyldiphosphodolichol N-acetylglucosaminyltransferase catalytic subunit alg13 [Podospora pseudopauciseta]|uniref:UDP-N-acetylglucosamine transferase subunit ALG13 n=2 Tax=Podospora TaxID=5144 RepID=A0ABR0HBW6_9PEZI|nr:N-acetylglucosaminyldiphosphodolichol N-acetylglucosaminyltransferase catalytic subunit alg13 [Podospora pseudopauciseta]KAK4676714.1 N-acetylglucosaminyldiphosphodolichol N-acetylglucosaminyltransferase catalytic subunit alg13 [Podospora pseudoanserina]